MRIRCKQKQKCMAVAIIKRLRRLFFVGWLLAGFGVSAIAQMTITGVVKDNFGDVLPGASVLLKGSSIGSTTDLNGKYSITVPNAQSVLQFSFVGYATKEITVGDLREIDVILQEDTQQLE